MISLGDTPIEKRFNFAFVAVFSFIFVLAPSYYQPNPGGEGLFLPYNNILWVGASFMIALGLLRILSLHRFYCPRMFYAMLFFVVATTLIGIINGVSTPVSWLFRSLAIWGGVLFFLALSQFQLNQRWRDNLLYILLVSVLIQGCYGLVHVLISEPPFPSWLPHSPGIPRAIFQQQNLNASYSATGMLIATYLLTVPGYRSRGWFLKSLPLLALVVVTLNLVTAGSRVGLLGAGLGLVILLACRLPQIKRRYALLVSAAVLVLLAGYTGTQLTPQTGGIGKSVSKFNTALDQGDMRMMIYDSSWELFLEKPLLGYGIGQFEPVWHEKKISYLQQHPDAGVLQPRLSHPHNELFYWGIEGGLAALLGIAVLVLAFFWSCLRLGWQRGGSYLALLIPIALHTQVELPFYISQLHWLAFIALLALVASHQLRSYPVNISSMARLCVLTLALLLPVGTSIFATHNLLAIDSIMDYVQAKQKSLSMLDYSNRNFYFNRQSEFLQLQLLLHIGFEKDNKDVIRHYAGRAREYLQHTPDASVYAGLAMALRNLGEYSQSQYFLTKGLGMYPTHKHLLNARDKIQQVDKNKGVYEQFWSEGASGARN